MKIDKNMSDLKVKLKEFAYKAPNGKRHFLVNEAEMESILEVACKEAYKKTSIYFDPEFRDWFSEFIKAAM